MREGLLDLQFHYSESIGFYKTGRSVGQLRFGHPKLAWSDASFLLCAIRGMRSKRPRVNRSLYRRVPLQNESDAGEVFAGD
jgi:hypothetical protein